MQVSPRILDYFCREFCRDKKVIITNERDKSIIMPDEYITKTKGKGLSKFDFFARGVQTHFQGIWFRTQAQMDAYIWAGETGIIKYCKEHENEIRDDILG